MFGFLADVAFFATDQAVQAYKTIEDFALPSAQMVVATVHYATKKAAEWTASLASKWNAFRNVQLEVDLYPGFRGAALMALAMPSGDIVCNNYYMADMHDNGDGKGVQELSPKS